MGMWLKCVLRLLYDRLAAYTGCTVAFHPMHAGIDLSPWTLNNNQWMQDSHSQELQWGHFSHLTCHPGVFFGISQAMLPIAYIEVHREVVQSWEPHNDNDRNFKMLCAVTGPSCCWPIYALQCTCQMLLEPECAIFYIFYMLTAHSL